MTDELKDEKGKTIKIPKEEPVEEKKKPRGRPPLSSTTEKIKIESELKEEKYKSFEEIFKKPIEILNDIVFERVPKELIKKGFKPLSNIEINNLVKSIIPVLDKYDLLGFDSKPEYFLIITIFGISYPRYLILRQYQKEKEEEKIGD